MSTPVSDRRATARRLSLILLLPFGLAGLVAGCATPTRGPGSAGTPITPVEPPAVAPSSGTPPAGSAAKPAPGTVPATPIVTEQRWFEDWFRGTPVVISTHNGSILQVDVPLANSFDAGKSDIKPALAAVLERVSESLRRQVGARITVAAPPDAGGAATLAQARATKVRDLLVAKKIAPPRIAVAEGTRAGGPVQLRMTIPAVPIAKLEDSSLLVPGKGVKPASLSSRPASAPQASPPSPAKPR